MHTCMWACKYLPARAHACSSGRSFTPACTRVVRVQPCLCLHTRVHKSSLHGGQCYTCVVLHAHRTVLHGRQLHTCYTQKAALHAGLLHVPWHTRAHAALHTRYAENRGACTAVTRKTAWRVRVGSGARRQRYTRARRRRVCATRLYTEHRRTLTRIHTQRRAIGAVTASVHTQGSAAHACGAVLHARRGSVTRVLLHTHGRERDGWRTRV